MLWEKEWERKVDFEVWVEKRGVDVKKLGKGLQRKKMDAETGGVWEKAVDVPLGHTERRNKDQSKREG